MIVSLTPLPDRSPVPRIEVRLDEIEVFDGGDSEGTGGGTFDGGDAGDTGPVAEGGTAALFSVEIPAGTESFTLWRTVGDYEEKVRGAVDRSYLGIVALLDQWAPPNVTSSYAIECFAGDSAIGRVQLGSVILPWVGDPDEVIIQNPVNPRLNAVVRNMAGSWPTVTTDASGEEVTPEGASLPILVGQGPRRGAEGVELDFEAIDRDTAARVRATLGTPNQPQLQVWQIRTPNPGLLPPVFYCHVRQLVEEDITVGISHGADGGGISRFRAMVNQIQAPIPGVAAPTLRYSDLAAVFPTYTALKAALPTYSGMASAWEYAGAAGED